jgi:uracil phosphoribosyltransferase
MRTLLADHPLVTHKLTLLRDAATDTATFRRLADELVTLLAYEATREIRLTRPASASSAWCGTKSRWWPRRTRTGCPST